MEEKRLRFHHRHLPTFTKGIKFVVWKFSHLYLPFAIHILTDTYKDRLHHLVIDTFYVCVTAIFVSLNIGLGIWFYRYFTVPEIVVRIVAPQEMTSGHSARIAFVYQNNDRAIHDSRIDVYLPDGFIMKGNTERAQHDPVRFSIGDIAKNDLGMVTIEGIWFGDIEESGTIRAFTSYTYYHRTEHVVASHTMKVLDSAITASMQFKKAATYGTPVEGEIFYKNATELAQKNVEFVFQFPPHFNVQTIQQGDATLEYNQEKQSVTIPLVNVQEEGTLKMRGVFFAAEQGSTILSGDQEVPISGVVFSQLADMAAFEERIQHGSFATGVRVVHPRLFISMYGDTTVHFGGAITATVTVRNTGDVPAQNIRLRGKLTGIPVVSGATTVSVMDHGRLLRTDRAHGSSVVFPTIAEIPAGESRTYTVSIPTYAVGGQQLSSSFRVSGTGYSPDVDSVIPMNSVAFETKYHSQVQLSATPMYYDQNGEEIGYGPYPPKAWDTTAIRVVLRINNINNALSGVRIRTTIVPQMKWTGSYSVSRGTNVTWNPTSRIIEWDIPSLAPQTNGVGAQFEVRFTPNHLQVGKKLPITDVMTLNANDTFTGVPLSQTINAVVLPVAIVP